MKFTIELKPFTKMVETVSKKMPGQKKAEAQMRLFACAARVFVESNQVVAGVETLVFEDGTCLLPRVPFREVLKTFRGRKNLTVEVDPKGLHIGGFSMRVTEFGWYATPPAKFQVFPVTDLAVLGRGQQSQTDLEDVAALKKLISRIPMSQVVVAAAIDFARRTSSLPQTPKQLKSGLGRALEALGRWPEGSEGVDVRFRVGLPYGTLTDFFGVHIAATVLELFYEGAESGTKPPETTIVYQSKLMEVDQSRQQEGFMLDDVSNWLGWAKQLFEDEDPAKLLVRIEDRSESEADSL